MNKRIKTATVVLLSFLTASVIFSSCGKKNQAKIDGIIKEISSETVLEDSDKIFVQNGLTEYKIIYPEDTSDEMIQFGVKEMQSFVKEATGVSLLSVSDENENVLSGDGKYISIGKTTLFQDAIGEQSLTDLGNSGFVIKLIDDNLFICGGYHGNLYGVYEFLKHQFGFEVYAEDEIYIEKFENDVKLKNYNLKVVPDIDYRVGGNGDISGYAGLEFMNRMRMMTFGDVFCGSFSDIPPFHNFFEFIPPEEFQSTHPDWFSPSGVQLCLGRDPEGLMDTLVPRMIALLERDYTRNIITFTQEDGPTWCNCDTCKYKGQSDGDGSALPVEATSSNAEKEHYTAQDIKFVNELAKRIKEEYTPENGYKHARSVYVYCFAYGMTGNCPVKTDASGNPVLTADGDYQIFDDTLEIQENFGVLYCYGFSTSYTGEYNNDTKNIFDRIKRWKTVTNHFALWAYSTHFIDYFCPYDSIQQLQDTVKFCVDAGAQMYYNMAQYDIKTAPDWGRFESYMQAKLSWDKDADVEKLTNDFFDNYFKQAAPVMKEMYKEYRTHMAYLATVNKVGTTINTSLNVVTQKNWPYEKLLSFLDYIDRAYAAIDNLRIVNPETYSKLYDRINIESFSYRYLLYKLYPDTFDYDTLSALQTELINEARNAGVTEAKEHGDISGLFD